MSVFRELFVEVPIAILEAALKEKLEAREAENRHVEVSRAAQLHINFEYAARKICATRGLDLIDTYRLVDADVTVLRVRLPCRHVGRFSFDETILVRAASPREVVNYVLDKMDEEPERRCKCGTPQGLGPAGRPT